MGGVGGLVDTGGGVLGGHFFGGDFLCRDLIRGSLGLALGIGLGGGGVGHGLGGRGVGGGGVLCTALGAGHQQNGHQGGQRQDKGQPAGLAGRMFHGSLLNRNSEYGNIIAYNLFPVKGGEGVFGKKEKQSR